MDSNEELLQQIAELEKRSAELEKRSAELQRQISCLLEQNTDLQNKLSFFRTAIDQMPNSIFMKGEDGRFLFFNRQYARNFSMRREDYLGKTVLDLDYLPEEDRKKYQAEDLRLIQTGEICSYDKDFVFYDGKIHPNFYWSKGFICEDTGEHGLVGEIVDISVEREDKISLTRLLQGTACMFDRFFVLDLKRNTFTHIKKMNDSTGEDTAVRPLSLFLENTRDRFYNPVNNHPMDWYFTAEGLCEVLKEKNDSYFECKDKFSRDSILGTTLYCAERENGRVRKVIFASRDITDAKKMEHDYRKSLQAANERLKDLANHDGLTGLYNRRGLMEAIRVQLTQESRVAVLLIDVDKFKTVNDSFGHQCGDKLLIKVAELLRLSFRTNDILVRLGGDEFMAILLDCERDHGAFILQKIQRINEKLQISDDDTPVGSISAGIAFSREEDGLKVYEKADTALYRAKINGRCGCCIYEEESDETGLR